MEGVLKKGVILLVVLFLGFWMIQDPTGFGTSAKSAISTIWDGLTKLFNALISVVQS